VKVGSVSGDRAEAETSDSEGVQGRVMVVVLVLAEGGGGGERNHLRSYAKSYRPRATDASDPVSFG